MLDHHISAAGYRVTLDPETEPSVAVIVNETEPLMALTEPGPLADLRLHLTIAIAWLPDEERWHQLMAILTHAWATHHPYPLRLLLYTSPTTHLTLTGEVEQWGYEAAGYPELPATASGHPGIVPESVSTLLLTLTEVVLYAN